MAKTTLISTLSLDLALTITRLLPLLLPVLMCTALSPVPMVFLLRWLHMAARNTNKLASALLLSPARMVQALMLRMAKTLEINDTLITSIKDTHSNTRNINNIHRPPTLNNTISKL